MMAPGCCETETKKMKGIPTEAEAALRPRRTETEPWLAVDASAAPSCTVRSSTPESLAG